MSQHPASDDEVVSDELRTVTAFYKLNGIMSVDLAKRTILVDFALKLKWLSSASEDSSWAPELVILNACDEPHVKDRAVTTEKNEISTTMRSEPTKSGKRRKNGGADHRPTKKLYLRLYAELWQELDLTCFPFDIQNFVVATRFPRHRTQGIGRVLIQETTPVIFEPGFRNFSGMQIMDTSARVELQGSVGDLNTKPTAVMTLVARRESFYYTLNVGLPLCVMVAVAFDAFLLDPEQHVERIALIVTVMLTVVTFKTTLGERMPVLIYTTVMDRWIVFLFLLLFCMAAESIAVFVIIRNHSSLKADELNCAMESKESSFDEVRNAMGVIPASSSTKVAALALAHHIDMVASWVLGVLFVFHTALSVLFPTLMAGKLSVDQTGVSF
jgi:hypothetical protein